MMSVMKKYISCILVLCASVSFSVSSAIAHTEDGEDKHKAIVTEVLLDKEPCSWDGKKLDAYLITQPAITLLKISIPPKMRLQSHYHSVINVGYMLEGELTVVAENGQTTTIKAGEPLVEMVGRVHYGENRGDSPAVILVFYAGDATTPITTTVE